MSQSGIDSAAVTPADISQEKPRQKLDVTEMAITFVSPALFGKLMLLYFGSMYSKHPGEGYGVGLCVAIAFTLIMVGRFVWKYKDYSED